MSVLSELKVFTTHPHACSYLEEQQATTLFVDPQAEITEDLYDALAENGFRRSGPHLYRPHCESCNACIPARIPVQLFEMKRRHRRVWKKNADLIAEPITDIRAEECYELYCRYINSRHDDGDMYPPDREQYESFLSKDFELTEFIGFRHRGRLLAVAVIDRMPGGLSAIYTFFDPEEQQRSLGAYAILWQVDYARREQLPYVYLGYWIKSCRKMSYKIEYRPLQLLINRKWLTLS